VQNIIGAVNSGKDFIVIKKTNLTTLDLEAASRISAKENPVAFFTPRLRSFAELVRVLVRKRTYP